MLTEEQLEQLKSDKELLELELEDVNQLIKIREEELDLLRKKADEARALRSRLDMQLYELEQMQNNIGEHQQKAAGFDKRMEEMENELFASIQEQLQLSDTLKDYTRVKANLQYTESELEEANTAYRQLKDAESKKAEAESNLELAMIEISSLKEELSEMRELNEYLKNK